RDARPQAHQHPRRRPGREHHPQPAARDVAGESARMDQRGRAGGSDAEERAAAEEGADGRGPVPARAGAEAGGRADLSWISATGQRWKLHVFVALIVLTFAWLLGLLVSLGGEEDWSVPFALGMAGTAIAAHLWIAVGIRCATCHRRVGWFVLATAGKQWLLQLWRGESCPACGARAVPG